MGGFRGSRVAIALAGTLSKALLWAALLIGAAGVTATAASAACAVDSSDFPELSFANPGDGTTYVALLTSDEIYNYEVAHQAEFPGPNPPNYVCMGDVSAQLGVMEPGVNLADGVHPGVTQQGGSIKIVRDPNPPYDRVLYLPPSPGFAGDDSFTLTDGDPDTTLMFTVHVGAPPTPSITALSPDGGPVVGGGTVVITGDNFVGATAVRFETTAATSFTVDSATQISAVAPAHAAGSVDVTVTRDSTSATTAASRYRYVVAPVVTNVSPASGPTNGGTTVTLTGSGFTGATAVRFGSVPASSFTVNGDSSITATAPAVGTGTVDVTVTTLGGTSTTTAADQFDYYAVPVVTGLSPDSGPEAGGTSIIIAGSGFGGATAVTFGATPASSFSVDSATQITAIAPAGSGVVDVTVTTSGGTSSANAVSSYRYAPVPVIADLSPGAGAEAGGDSVTITGSGFSADAMVSFGGTVVTPTVDSATQLRVAAPAGSGAVAVTVTTAGGTSAPASYDYVAPPSITAIAPDHGAAEGGAEVTITGSGFDRGGTATVVFGGTAATVVSVASDTSIVATAPPHTVGTVDIVVTTPFGTSAAVGAGQFTYVAKPAAPVVTAPVGGALLANAAPTYAGTAGANLTIEIRVDGASIGTTGADGGGAWSLASATALGDGNHSVAAVASTAGGIESDASAAVSFTVDTSPPAAPVIAAPVDGSVTDSTVTISGTAEPGAILSLDSDGAGSTMSVDGAGNWTVDLAGLAPGAHTVSAIATDAAGNTGPASAITHYTVATAPIVTAISPDSGPVAGGSGVTIDGSGFTGATAVRFGAAAAASFTVVSDTNIVAQTPPGAAGPVAVTVTNPAGTSTPGAATRFEYLGPPTVADRNGVTVAYDTAKQIDLSGAITGAHTSVAAADPAHGSVSVAGDVVTYTPTSGYYGVDSFTYTATGAGGTSTPATVSLTIDTPPAPVVSDKAGVSVPYETATPIGLSGSISGVHDSIALATAPSHGTTRIAGDVITYTPGDGYYGSDSFTYTATGPGGTSAPAAVTVTVGTPAAPSVADRNGVAVGYQTATPVDLSGSISGVHDSIAVARGPAHGTTSVAGDVITYTPADGYYGGDRFTYRATGPGGTSASATVSLTVATPAAPTAADRDASAAYETVVAIDLSGSIGGVHTATAVVTAPAHGSTSVSGDVVTYTPADGYYGGDGFTYAATGPGGTSAPATVAITVGNPAAPTAADKDATAPYETATKIDLSGSISGVHDSIAVATGPAHGTASVSGDVVTYAPTDGYYGGDTFTYTATGPGGVSAPATVHVTVHRPAAPAAADRDVETAYQTAIAVDLSGAVGGVHNSIAVASAPSHGSTSVQGDVVTYTPAAAYYGTDSFTYVATGPGGASSPATVTITVDAPAAPIVADKSVDTDYQTAVAIDLSAAITGVHTSIAVAAAPAHGTTAISGDVVTFAPANGYYGADSFTYTATGPGGTSQPATVSLTVATPAAPTVDSSEVVTETDGETDVDLSSLIDGVYSGVRIITQPEHGTVTLSGNASAGGNQGITTQAVESERITAHYEAQAGFAGTDSFGFAAVGPGGTSSPATVRVKVVGAAPTLVDQRVETGDAETVSIDLTAGATGGPFTGAAIVATTPADAATTELVEGGPADARTYMLQLRPDAHFDGRVTVRYTLSNVFGTSAPATITVDVTARPDPSTDPRVRAISDAQAEVTRSFSRAQVGNFMRRAESLHGGGRRGWDMGVRLRSLDPSRRMSRDMRGNGIDRASDGLYASGERPDRRVADARDDRGGGESPTAEASGMAGFWVGGAIDIGTRDATTDRAKITATTAGLSGGVDMRVAEGLTLGIGGGYGDDTSTIDGGRARVRSKSKVVVLYGSAMPVGDAFIDGLLAYGDLDFATRRDVGTGTAGAIARGTRDGDMKVAALSAGIDRNDGRVGWSLYGRGEYLNADLDAYRERGAGRLDLRFDRREIRSLLGVVGGRIDIAQDVGFGIATPYLRGEWQHEFEDAAVQGLDYADVAGPTYYGIGTNGWTREQFALTLGTRLESLAGWSVDLSLDFRASSGERVGSLGLQIGKSF